MNAPMVIVGLAPGLKGANRTGKAFTGDASGRVLFQTLDRFGLVSWATAVLSPTKA
ncbi:MAG: uracil-DNA glycosylase family protein [Pseudomonadota bacterium]